MNQLLILEEYRNYNLGRLVDNKSVEFEKKLKALCEEYGVYKETETFETGNYKYETH